MLLDPKPAQTLARMADFAHLRSSAAAELGLRRAAPPPAHPLDLNRPIQKQCWRLDLNPTLSEPSDPDPSAQIQSYRFGLAIFLKSPWTFRELTRSPLQFKSNYSSAQKLTRTPLSFLKIEPAIQA